MHKSQNPSDSAAHQHLSRLISLRRNRAHRDRTGLFVIEAVRQFIHAAEAHFEFDTLLISPMLLRERTAQKLVRRLGTLGVRKVVLTPEQFRSICTTEHASGVAAIVRQRWTPLAAAVPVARESTNLGWLVIDALRSPGNLGTILRTAEAVGMSGVIFVGDLCDPCDPAVIRASMGGVFGVRLVRTSPRELGYWLAAHGVELLGLAPYAARVWTDLPSSPGGYALALGDERDGLSPALRRLCDTDVKLPMFGRADSLNVAVAAGVMMYELVRRRCDETRAMVIARA